MLEMRPVSIANIVAASVRFVAVLFGKFVVSNNDVVPVFTGSLAAIPNVAVGTLCVPIFCCQLLTCVKLPPNVIRCEPRIHVMLSIACHNGVLRRDWLLER